MRRRTTIITIAGLIAVSAATLAILQSWLSARRDQLTATRSHAVMQALVAFAQNNNDGFPPPDQAAAPLVAHGLLAPDQLRLPRVPADQPAFFLVTPASPERWTNSFTTPHPILYTNPAATSDGSIIVFGNDNFSQHLSPSAAANFLARYSSHSHPLN